MTTLEAALRTALIGIGATMIMDLWALVLRRFGIPSLNFGFLGRWIAHLPEGQVMHASIAKATPVEREVLIGWCAHYSIGVAFAALLLSTFGSKWARSPSLLPALFIGVITVLAPLLVLQPAMGAGIASSKSRDLYSIPPRASSHTPSLALVSISPLSQQRR